MQKRVVLPLHRLGGSSGLRISVSLFPDDGWRRSQVFHSALDWAKKNGFCNPLPSFPIPVRNVNSPLTIYLSHPFTQSPFVLKQLLPEL